jgi:glucokinase
LARELVVGADVGGTNVKATVVAADGHPLWQDDIRTDPADPVDTIDRLAAAVAAWRERAAIDAEVGAVGLACAGIVDRDSGRLGRSPNLPGWEGVNLLATLRAGFGDLALTVANDVNAAVYGEYLYGAGQGCQDLVMIAMGTGVGGGVLVRGELVTGFGHGAGEIGHMTLDLDGPDCTCGNRGCLEAYCGSVGLLQEARRLAAAGLTTAAWRDLVAGRGEALTTRDCHALAEAGDKTALAFFGAAGRRLGQAVASLVNVLAPERVIIGGGVALAGDLILDPCRAMVARHVIGTAGRATPVTLAALGPHAAARGAAALARRAGASP